MIQFLLHETFRVYKKKHLLALFEFPTHLVKLQNKTIQKLYTRHIAC